MSMAKEMTSGKPYKLILGFCIPMIFGNIFQQLYNMVDSIIVGQYVGVDALAAVGSTGAINFLVIGFALGLCSGFSILAAQSFGEGNYKEMRRYVINTVYLCAIAAVILTVSTILLTGPILRITKTPDDIFKDAYDYIIIIFGGISATIFYNMLAGILRALGDSRTPLIFLGVSSVLNVILDLVLIIAFNMGVAGAGFATVISQAVSAVLCLIYMKRNYDILAFEKDELAFSGKRSLKLISIGLPMALQFSITAIGTIIAQSAVNSLGKTAIAAVTAANKIQTIVTAPMESLGITMATYCGQNRGAGKYTRIRAGIRQSLSMSMIYCAAACLVVWFLGGYIGLLFVKSSETEVLRLSVEFLRYNGVFYPTLGILFILRNGLQGMGYSMLPMLAGVSELVARTLVILLFIGTFGFQAACLASPLAWVLADLLLVTVYAVKMRSLKTELITRWKTAKA